MGPQFQPMAVARNALSTIMPEKKQRKKRKPESSDLSALLMAKTESLELLCLWKPRSSSCRWEKARCDTLSSPSWMSLVIWITWFCTRMVEAIFEAPNSSTPMLTFHRPIFTAAAATVEPAALAAVAVAAVLAATPVATPVATLAAAPVAAALVAAAAPKPAMAVPNFEIDTAEMESIRHFRMKGEASARHLPASRKMADSCRYLRAALLKIMGPKSLNMFLRCVLSLFCSCLLISCSMSTSAFLSFWTVVPMSSLDLSMLSVTASTLSAQ
mmetsp:Transcript_12011/g.20278  ORF Transcript_12011/g.20278 Transcript_12011/m.20278 type:complete len:271 (-) Transcript_12011:1672-2484(-)